ncbi:MAG: cupredoxin domain-containing protein [Deltaproteobacteria bacterium]|nr:cupredoxin domain-containing protein [Deltaproteobacteria bacterium]
MRWSTRALLPFFLAACATQGEPQIVDLTVTQEGFVPAEVKVKTGRKVKLRVTRNVEATCATEIVFKDLGINQTLPLNQTVEVELTPSKPGKIRYACAMDMIAGELIAE